MIMRSLFVLPLAISLTASTGQAGSLNTIDGFIDAMLASQGESYLAARQGAAQALADDPELAKALAPHATFTGSDWQRSLMVSIVLAHHQYGGVAARLHNLQGLKPGVYLERRRPEPAVGGELRQIAPHAAPLLAELLLKTFDAYPFAKPDEYYQKWRPQLEDLRLLERRALRDGLIAALGASGHPASLPVLKSLLNDAAEGTGVRSLALLSLAQSNSDAIRQQTFDLAHAILNDSHATPPLRLAAIRACGMLKDPRAIDDLVSLTGNATDLEAQLAAVSALGSLGAQATWTGRTAPPLATRRQISTVLLQTLANDSSPTTLIESAVNSLALVALPESLEPLQKLHQQASGEHQDILRRGVTQLQLALRRQ